MARLPYLEADQVAPEYRDMLKRNTNLHKLLVNSPEMARAFNGIGGSTSASRASSTRACGSLRSSRSAGWRSRNTNSPIT
ncbi:hypothetical protein ACVWWK_007268 [Bradyrhizobium sp. LB9.1b]